MSICHVFQKYVSYHLSFFVIDIMARESDLAVRGSNIPTPLPEPSERQVIWMNGNEYVFMF